MSGYKFREFLNLSSSELKDSKFSRLLKEAREAKDMTKASIARAIGVTPVMITRYENNAVSPSEQTLTKIISLFDDEQQRIQDNKKQEEIELLEKELKAIEEQIKLLAKLRAIKQK